MTITVSCISLHLKNAIGGRISGKIIELFYAKREGRWPFNRVFSLTREYQFGLSI